MSIRLLALDIDGTLLDPYGALTPSVREAVGEARRAGLRIVLCTGRRYRTALPILRELALEGAVVVNNGAVVKDVASAATLDSAYLPAEVYAKAYPLMRDSGAPLVYVDDPAGPLDMLIEHGAEMHPFQAGYLDDHGQHCGAVAQLHAAPDAPVIMMSRMADEATLAPLEGRVREQLGERVTTHLIWNKNYQGLILEVLSPRSGKWAALERLAAQHGVAPGEIAAVGDDRNDVGLVGGAGLGIAMGNAVDEVKAVAQRVVRSNAEGGVVDAIRHALQAA